VRPLLAALALALALAWGALAPAPAAAQPPHPFCGSGREYAHGHIVPLAQSQEIGPEQAGRTHSPGSHRGFAVCEPPPGD
jgi:hypothetical protein